MKGRSLILTALLTIAAGVALILFYNTITLAHIVLVCALLFILAGVVNMITFVAERGSDGQSHRSSASIAFGWITCTGTMILGLAMLIFRSNFLTLVPFMFGILVAFAALFQFFLLAVGSRPVRLPGWLYVSPMLLVGAGVYIFFQRTAPSSTILMITGISIALFGVTMLIESVLLGTAHRRMRRAEKATVQPEEKAPATTETAQTSTENTLNEKNSIE